MWTCGARRSWRVGVAAFSLPELSKLGPTTGVPTAAVPETCFCTSSFVIRPPSPEPGTDARLTPCSAATFRAVAVARISTGGAGGPDGGTAGAEDGVEVGVLPELKLGPTPRSAGRRLLPAVRCLLPAAR